MLKTFKIAGLAIVAVICLVLAVYASEPPGPYPAQPDEHTALVDVTHITRIHEPILIFFVWGVSLVTSIITLPLGIVRLRAQRPVVRIIAFNRLIGLTAGLLCLCALIGRVNMLLLIQGTITPNATQAQMAARWLSRILNYVSISILVCGLNGLIAFAFNQNWKGPQLPPA